LPAFVTDSPSALVEADDEFGHCDYVEALVETARNAPSPFTLGLFGRWGSGKSSILGAAGRRIATLDRTAFFGFDVWKYEGDSLRRQFVTDLANQLRDAKALKRGFNVERHLERFDADVTSTRARWFLDLRALLTALVFGVVAGGATYGLSSFLVDVGVTSDDAMRATTAAAAGLLAATLTMASKAIGAERVQVARPRLEDADRFAASFAKLLTKGLDADRLVVGIDNLDRCSPTRASELLAVIKTFLEPASQGKSLVFIVATDDQALRRHLIAQELKSSPQKQHDGEKGAPVPSDVAHAVDEFLRKYFNGVLRVADPLPNDMSNFVHRLLEPFAKANKIDSATESALAEVVVGSLGGNPRRLKQFLNGLQIRIMLLQERRRQRRLSVDPDALAVAEVLVLEERWPERLQDLRREPLMAAVWRRDAIEKEIPDDEVIAPEVTEWLEFLRSCTRIGRCDLRPYLDTKESATDIELPLFRAFAEALTTPDQTAKVRQVLNEAAAARERYIDSVWPLYREQVRTGRWVSADAVLRAVIAIPELGKRAAPDILRDALHRPRLWVRFREIRPRDLLRIGESLETEERDWLISLMLRTFAAEDPQGADARRLLCEALGEWAGTLGDHHRERIREALARPNVARQIGSYISLAESVPALIPPTCEAVAREISGSSECSAADRALAARLLAAVEPSNNVGGEGSAGGAAEMAPDESAGASADGDPDDDTDPLTNVNTTR
jgi:hypothetical protein